MFGDLHRVMRIKNNRGIMQETIGITLLYEMDDVGYGALGWVCKGFLCSSHPSYINNIGAWLDGKLVEITQEEGELISQ